MKIIILDHKNNRAIVAEVPTYLADADVSSDDIAAAILNALGLSHTDCEYMVGEFNVQIDVNTLNSGHGYNQNAINGIEQLTGDFKIDALQALKDNTD